MQLTHGTPITKSIARLSCGTFDLYIHPMHGHTIKSTEFTPDELRAIAADMDKHPEKTALAPAHDGPLPPPEFLNN